MLRFIDCQKVTQRSSIIKMIHGWEPTYGCLCRQGRESSPLCPQCYQTVETSAHYRTCTADQATAARINFLGDILIEMEWCHTSSCILAYFEYKLSLTLKLSLQTQTYVCHTIDTTEKALLMTTIRHQNIIGWDNALKGYTSSYWPNIQNLHQGSSTHRIQRWIARIRHQSKLSKALLAHDSLKQLSLHHASGFDKK
jgi:hypothetical protein